MSGLNRVGSLLGSMVALADIRPPGRSFEDWERFLREAAPVAAFETESIPAILGMAIWKRKRWLEDARKEGLSYAAAEQLWNAAADRDHDAFQSSMREQEARMHRAMREREGKRPDDASAIFGRARDLGL